MPSVTIAWLRQGAMLFAILSHGAADKSGLEKPAVRAKFFTIT
jgi:hypothetical protein